MREERTPHFGSWKANGEGKMTEQVQENKVLEVQWKDKTTLTYHLQKALCSERHPSPWKTADFIKLKVKER